MRWTEGCTPRVTLITCSSVLRTSVRWSKAVTLVFQLLAAGTMLRPLASREQRQGVGLAQAVVLACSLLGSLHSASMVAMYPSEVSQEGLLLFLEYVYSLYGALLIASLAFLNRIWLERYLLDAFPGSAALLPHTLRAARLGGWALVALTVAIAVASDTALAASPYMSTFEAVVHVQHFAFMLICACSALASIALPGRLLRLARGAAEGPPGSLGRLWVAQLLIALIWAFCALICAACALAGAASDARNPSAGAEAMAWALHASFMFSGGGAIASLTYVLLHRPGLLDSLARLGAPRAKAPAEP